MYGNRALAAPTQLAITPVTHHYHRPKQGRTESGAPNKCTDTVDLSNCLKSELRRQPAQHPEISGVTPTAEGKQIRPFRKFNEACPVNFPVAAD